MGRRVPASARREAAKQRAVVDQLIKRSLSVARRGVEPKLGIKGIRRKLQPLLRDCGVASFLVGWNAVMEQRPIAASNPFMEVLKSFSTRIGLRLSRLRDFFGDKASDVLSKLSSAAEERLAEVLEEEAEEGMHVRQGTAHLAEAFKRTGISPTNSYQIENAFRTQTLLGYGAGRWKACQDPAVQEILEAFRYVTAGDDRVREEHEALDGMVAGADSPIWHYCWPPNGYSCRCQCLMVFNWDGEEDVPDEGTLQAAITPGFGYNPGELL